MEAIVHTHNSSYSQMLHEIRVSQRREPPRAYFLLASGSAERALSVLRDWVEPAQHWASTCGRGAKEGNSGCSRPVREAFVVLSDNSQRQAEPAICNLPHSALSAHIPDPF